MRALVVECLLQGEHSRVEEVKSMAESIGYVVQGEIVQPRASVHHTYCIGPGKVDEIPAIVSRCNVDTIIFTNTLPGSQVFKIQRRIGGDVKVIDRNLVILEVFEKRAMTKEAKLEIELARLKYTFSWGREFIRLSGIASQQVGRSGPGEYPYKEYEKAARKRISRIKEALRTEHSKKSKLRERRHELGYPIIALAGYTQSGKTTFFNHLVAESKPVGLGPFTTLTTCARKVNHNGRDMILVDSIGFIEEMHPIILNAFNVTLGEIANADLVLLFVAANEGLTVIHKRLASSNKVLREIGLNCQLFLCANKIDLVNHESLQKVKSAMEWHFPGVPQFTISAKTGENVEQVLDAADETFSSRLHPREAVAS